ncbi:hypothetical protein FHS90_000278 [Rufibacter quisquiliarum]|uniref:Uncharacterized protein n=1 Tax=Rufibacter quisquiliarum TaxID=1549639 RepID=A0A839GP09_9BACT|nr:hypothetical protein [Rufibacter quisquiliarum]
MVVYSNNCQNEAIGVLELYCMMFYFYFLLKFPIIGIIFIQTNH